MKYISLLEFVLDFVESRSSISIFDNTKTPGFQLIYDGNVSSFVKDIPLEMENLFAPVVRVHVTHDTHLALCIDPSKGMRRDGSIKVDASKPNSKFYKITAYKELEAENSTEDDSSQVSYKLRSKFKYVGNNVSTLGELINIFDDEKRFNIYMETGHITGDRSQVLTRLTQDDSQSLKSITPVFTGCKSSFMGNDKLLWLLDRPVFYINSMATTVGDLPTIAILIS